MSNNAAFDNISFDLPKNQSNVIKVIGVGGGGSNAINHMFQLGIKGVDFVVCNTDAQALQNSPVPNKIQLGVSLTEGLGAGANPEIGEQAAIESFEDIKTMLDSNTKMVFITAGMGGGTGTGAAPVIAKFAKELDILTVGIVTIPFQFEGKMRNEQAQIGVEKLRSNVDSLIVINNNKLREVYGNLGFKAGFSKADEVLATAARGIAEVITHHYTQNIDLRDAKTVLSDSGTAIMGSATASGSSRANEAIMKALDSPLLNDNKIKGAKNVLLLIVSGTQEITIDEIGEINDHIQNEAGHGANIIMGVGEDENLGDAISVTVIATGFNVEQQHDIVNVEAKKIIHTLEDEQKAEQELSSTNTSSVMDTPIQKPLSEEKAAEEETVVKYELKEEEETNESMLNLIPTSEIIRNIDVVYEEVKPEALEYEEFVIVDTTDKIKDIEVIDPEIVSEEDKNQITLSFDMPLSEQNEEERPNVVTFNLDESPEDVNDIEVTDHVEIIPVTEVSEEGEIRYSLDDYMELESKLTSAKPDAKEADVAEEELTFETKTKPVEEETKNGEEEEVDPLFSSIEETLRNRADERRKKLKEFNYKFNHLSKVDEFEKQPAYKRMGIDLDEENGEDQPSRMSLGEDSNDEIQLRSNNSFLHDNVD